jgi:hypothetical protein
VTQARNSAQQTAAFARRMVCRALTVVGGVAAGTALAWWLSSSAASAEMNLPAIDDAPAVVQQAVEPVEHVLDVVTRQLQDPPPPPKTSLGDLGQKVKDAADHFRANADKSLPKLPTCKAVCLDNERHMYTPDSFGRAELPSTPTVEAVTPPVVPGAAVDALVPTTAKDRAFADGMSRRGSPAPAQPTTPDLPNWPAPLPFAPTGLPTTGNHGSAGNAGDSHLFAALPWQDRDIHLVAGDLVATTYAATSGRPDAQPGVLPD